MGMADGFLRFPTLAAVVKRTVLDYGVNGQLNQWKTVIK